MRLRESEVGGARVWGSEVEDEGGVRVEVEEKEEADEMGTDEGVGLVFNSFRNSALK